MKTNPNPIEVDPRVPRKHLGFKDSLGKELKPGDEIIVKGYDRLYHAIITRFTPKRIYWTILYADDSAGDYIFDWDMLTQLHNWYQPDQTHHTNPKYHCKAEDHRRLRNVMKVDDPGYNPRAEVPEEINHE